ncbi:hypothetical protein GQ457_13G013820 [Hibiscus cannabinus]
MAESLLAKLGDLNFTAEEQDVVVVIPEFVAIPAEDFACSLVGRVVSYNPLDGGRVARLFRTIWKDDKEQTITEINPNFFLIAFASASNIDNVLKRGPWDFQNTGLRLSQLIRHVLSMIMLFDTRLEDGNMGEFLRVRVSLDTTKPLRRCVTLSRSNAKAVLCPLQYERIPIFYHGCGLVGHTVVKDMEVPPLSPAPSVASSPPASASAAVASVPTPAASVPVLAPIGPASEVVASIIPVIAGRVATGSAPMSAPPPCGKETADVDGEVPYDPKLHFDVSDALEDSLDIPKGCTLFSDIDGMVQSTGLDDVIDEVADALLRDVASSILGQVSATSAVPATVLTESEGVRFVA